MIGLWGLIVALLAALGLEALVSVKLLHRDLVELARDADETWAQVLSLRRQRDHEVHLLSGALENEGIEVEVVDVLRAASARAQAAADPVAMQVADGAVWDGLASLEPLIADGLQPGRGLTVGQLLARLEAIRVQILDRQEAYNAAVSRLNGRLDRLPGALVGRALGIDPRDPYPPPEDRPGGRSDRVGSVV